MAFLNICGFETGDLSEAFSSSGVVTVQSTTKRTGTYAAEIAAAGGASAAFAKHGTDGKAAVLGLSTCYVTVYIRVSGSFANMSVLPAGNDPATGGCGAVHVDASGNVTIKNGTGAASSPTIATLSLDTWYRIDAKFVQNGACLARVDGGTEQTVTGSNVAIDYVVFRTSNGIPTVHYDDLAISDSAYPGAGNVRVALPTGDSATNTAWSASAGNKFACIDELPPNGGTDYIESLTTAGDRRYSATHASCATLGISGAIGAVKTVAKMYEAASASTLGAVGIRTGSTNTELTNVDLGTTAVITMAGVWSLDPADAAAWTTTKVDGAEPLVKRSTSDTSNIRCDWLGLMVWSTGQVLVTVQGNQPAATGALGKVRLKSLAGAQPAAAGALALKKTLKTLAGAQAAPSGAIRQSGRRVTGSQPAATGALTVKRVLTHIALAGAQAAPSGALAKLRLVTLAGAQAAPSGALIIRQSKLVAGNQAAPSGRLRVSALRVSGNQAAPSGALAFKRVLSHVTVAGVQPSGSGALTLRWLFRQIGVAGSQGAATGAVVSLRTVFVVVGGAQPAGSGAVVGLFVVKLVAGAQPGASGLLVVLVAKTVAGNQPSGTGVVVALAAVKNVGFAPVGGRASLQTLGAGRASGAGLGAGRVRSDGLGGGRGRVS